MIVGVLNEADKTENRVAISPEIIKKLIIIYLNSIVYITLMSIVLSLCNLTSGFTHSI